MMPLRYAPHPSIPAIMPGMGWAVRPFSHEEHTSFLDAMERYGQDNTGEEWEKIAQAVGNGRSIEEVRMHAHEYFVSLQMVIQGEPDGHVLGTKIKKEDWTFEQDMVFEHAMAEFEETDPLRWMKVASLLPGKNHEDVRHRYQRLVYDVHKIEIAIPMEVKYKAPKAGKSLLAKVAPKSSSSAAKPRGLILKGISSSGSRGVPLASREELAGSKRSAKTLGSKARLALLRLEELEKEAVVRPSKPFKTKIKGKGGGYILSTKTSPRVPKVGGIKAQRAAPSSNPDSRPQRSASSSNSESRPQRAASVSSSEGRPQRASSVSNSESRPQRAASVSNLESRPQRAASVSSSDSRPQRAVSVSNSESRSSESRPQRAASASNFESRSQRAASVSSPESRPQRAASASNSESRPQRASSASNSESRTQRASSTPSSKSGGKGKGKGKAKSAAPAPAPATSTTASSKGSDSGKGPKGGTKGKEAAGGGSSRTALKRSAVTHSTNLKRMKVVERNMLRKPLGQRGAASGAPRRGGVPLSPKGFKNLGGGKAAEGSTSGGGKGTGSRRKSERARKRRVLDGQATETDEEDSDDEVQGSPQGHYNLRR